MHEIDESINIMPNTRNKNFLPFLSGFLSREVDLDRLYLKLTFVPRKYPLALGQGHEPISLGAAPASRIQLLKTSAAAYVRNSIERAGKNGIANPLRKDTQKVKALKRMSSWTTLRFVFLPLGTLKGGLAPAASHPLRS